MNREVRVFYGANLMDFLEERRRALAAEVRAEDRNRLLNMNEAQYVSYLIETYSLIPITFDRGGMDIDPHEELIDAKLFPPDYDVRRGGRFPRQVFTYRIPIRGDLRLLELRPSTSLMWTSQTRFEDGRLCFDIINWRDDPKGIRQEAEQTVDNLAQQADHARSEVEAFNQSLPGHAQRCVAARKAEILKQDGLVAALGVPIRRADNVPSTFAVPSIVRKIIVKPSAPTTAFAPEPALDPSVYEDILAVIHDFGVQMERVPSAYLGKDEEALRDLLLLVLAPNFHSVTGETFNKAGKTDILLRHEKSNVFVAECKFWKGIKSLSEACDQLLGYLTWRDSKAAVIVFVRNREMQPVLDEIAAKLTGHPCFVAVSGRPRPSLFRYEFRLPSDETRGVRLAVLCFYTPEK